MCEQFNIKVSNTAAEGLWSNGYRERCKVVEDVKCSLETAVAWAISVKNLLYSHNGYGPNQTVLGGNPNMPSVLKDKLPAMQPGEVSSITVRNDLTAMQKTLEVFVKCESSYRIKRAINNNIRSCNDVWFNIGDRVCHKQEKIAYGMDQKLSLVKIINKFLSGTVVNCVRLIHVDNVNF